MTSQVVGAAGGTVSAPDGTQVVIPAGALSSDVTITIALNESAPALTQALSVAPAHVFGPEGQTFAKPVSVTLPFQPANLPSGATEKDLAVYTAPQGSSAYEALPTTIKDATHVTGQATHFSNMCPGAILYDGGPLPDGAYGDAAVCTSLTPGAMVPLTFSDAGAPSLTGGAIASGTYDLTSITAYVPAGCTLNPGGPTGFSLTISFGSGTFEIAEAVTGSGGNEVPDRLGNVLDERVDADADRIAAATRRPPRGSTWRRPPSSSWEARTTGQTAEPAGRASTPSRSSERTRAPRCSRWHCLAYTGGAPGGASEAPRPVGSKARGNASASVRHEPC